MTFTATKKTRLIFGNGGITPELLEEGYFATLCLEVIPQTVKKEIRFVDTHLTREQLVQLRNHIDEYLQLSSM